MEQISEAKMFNGMLRRFSHKAASLGSLDAKFAIYIPNSNGDKLPCIYYLSGLTCTDENCSQKGTPCFERASELGVIIVLPDTSPRGAGIPGEDDDWDFGTGAGFYVDATEEPWKKNYNMYSYVTQELYELINANFPVNTDKVSIMGHSMGGHGALTIALKNQGKYKSASAFAPISNPSKVPWGVKAFSNYLGKNEESWKQHDTCELLRKPVAIPILVDQGTKDGFYCGDVNQLQPDAMKEAMASVVAADGSAKDRLLHNMREGYDHSYFFISTFIKNHVDFHMRVLE